MNITELCGDILSLIEDEVKNHPKYKFKKVIQEIEEGLCDERQPCERYPNLIDIGLRYLVCAPPYTTATYYSWENGGFWFDPCNDRMIHNETWILKEYNDGLNECGECGLPHPITGQPLPHQVQVQAF